MGDTPNYDGVGGCEDGMVYALEFRSTSSPKHDPVNHPAHYTAHPSGVECITVVEHMSFNLGNAVKYIWRAGSKGDAVEDLEKAVWYLRRELERLRR